MGLFLIQDSQKQPFAVLLQKEERSAGQIPATHLMQIIDVLRNNDWDIFPLSIVST